MLPAPTGAVGLDVSGRQQAIEIDTALSQPMGSAVIGLRRGQSVGMEVISARPGACRAPVTAVSYATISVGINGGYDRYLPVKFNGRNTARLEFAGCRPLQVDMCASVVEVAGCQRP